MVRRLCAIQFVASILAVFLVCVEEELFLLAGPVLTLIGFVISWIAVARLHRKLLVFGLASPFFVSLISALIAFFDLGPSEAQPAILVLLSLNTIVTCCVMYKIGDGQAAVHTVGGLRFSMLHLLGTTTAVCILLSLFRVLSGQRFTMVFAVYSTIVWAIMFAFIFLFVRKGHSV